MSCKLGDIIDFISMQLNDAFNKEGLPVEPGSISNIRWSRPLIKRYVANAVIASSVARPDLFTEQKEITLDPGCVQNVCDDGCDAFGGFIKILNDDGCVKDEEEKDVSSKFKKVLKRFSDLECLLSRTIEDDIYVTGDIKSDSINPCIFYVENPVPEGEEIKAIVNCINYPDATDIINGNEDYELPPVVCGKLRPAIYEYIMHQAWEIDLGIDKQLMNSRQKQHMDNFLFFVKIDDEVWKKVQDKLKDRYICEADCSENGKEK